MSSLSRIKSKLKKILGRNRYFHSLRVMQTAKRLALHYKADLKRAELAGLLHDCARSVAPRCFIVLARSFGVKISPVERKQPKLLHAFLSAKIAASDFRVKDKAVLRSIALHTLGAERMTKLDKIIYLADHIEPARNFPGVAQIRKLAFLNMDRAIAASTSAMIKSLKAKKLPIASQTLLTRKAHLK